MSEHGTLVVISSPSGGGKNTIVDALIRVVPNAARLVTTTSRPPRGNEKEGVDYYYIDKAVFEQKIASGDFVEHNMFVGNYYGTEAARLHDALHDYRVVFAVVDVNGKKHFDAHGIPHLSIFLLPESLDILRERIRHRGGLTEEQIDGRIRTAEEELKSATGYAYRVVNRDGAMDDTVAEVLGILQKEGVLDKKARNL